MPLTFAHPAAALPLRRLRLPLSALVVGTIAPDFVYYVQLAPRGHFGHTLPGLFAFCLPAGLVVLWLFHGVLKGPLVALGPEALQRRLAPDLASSPFDRPLALVAALLVGAVTHDVWDAFTHGGGWGVGAVPALRRPVALGGPLGLVPAYRLAQHGSTALGLAALAGAVAAWWRRAPQSDVGPLLPVSSRAARLLALTVPRLCSGPRSPSSTRPARRLQPPRLSGGSSSQPQPPPSSRPSSTVRGLNGSPGRANPPLHRTVQPAPFRLLPLRPCRR